MNEQEQQLFAAIREGNLAAVERLMAAGGINLEVKDTQSYTALMLAARIGHHAIVTKLINARAEIEAADNDRYTSLNIAACYGHHAIVTKLIEAGAKINAADIFGNTPLHRTMNQGLHGFHHGHHASAIELINARPNFEALSFFGQTALHLAARHGHLAIVTKLIEAGANLHTENRDGETALTLATQHCHPEIQIALLAATQQNNENKEQITTVARQTIRNRFNGRNYFVTPNTADINLLDVIPLEYPIYDSYSNLLSCGILTLNHVLRSKSLPIEVINVIFGFLMHERIARHAPQLHEAMLAAASEEATPAPVALTPQTGALVFAARSASPAAYMQPAPSSSKRSRSPEEKEQDSDHKPKNPRP